MPLAFLQITIIQVQKELKQWRCPLCSFSIDDDTEPVRAISSVLIDQQNYFKVGCLRNNKGYKHYKLLFSCILGIRNKSKKPTTKNTIKAKIGVRIELLFSVIKAKQSIPKTILIFSHTS